MTLQDYINLSQDSLNVFFDNAGSTLANIVAAIVTLAVGVSAGWILKWVFQEVSRAINLERTLANWGWYAKLVKSHEGIDVTNVLGELLRWTAIIVFVIPAVSALQIEGSDAVFSVLFSYLTNIILASLYLLFGFVIAWFVRRSLLIIGEATGIVPAAMIANTAWFAIVVFAGIQAVLQLGVTTDLIRLFVIALFLASALAFGLAGRDTAADWLKRILEKIKG